jgi:hypothetical protein
MSLGDFRQTQGPTLDEDITQHATTYTMPDGGLERLTVITHKHLHHSESTSA